MFYIEILRILGVVNNNFFGTQGFSLPRDVGYSRRCRQSCLNWISPCPGNHSLPSRPASPFENRYLHAPSAKQGLDTFPSKSPCGIYADWTIECVSFIALKPFWTVAKIISSVINFLVPTAVVVNALPSLIIRDDIHSHFKSWSMSFKQWHSVCSRLPRAMSPQRYW